MQTSSYELYINVGGDNKTAKEFFMIKNKMLFSVLLGVILIIGLSFSNCATVSSKQWGIEGNDTIGINLAATNIGNLYMTAINGETTGAKPPVNILYGLGSEGLYINPIYVKLTGNPIIFTIMCPVASQSGNTTVVSYKSCELRLTMLSNIKAGDVLTIRWMYQTQTFAFIDATGNIIQQTIPTFY